MVSLYKVKREEFTPVKVILESVYPREVEFSSRITGRENVFIVDDFESIVEISAFNPYSKIVLSCEDRYRFSVDEVLEMAALGVRKIANIYDVDDMLNKIASAYSEKVYVPIAERQMAAEIYQSTDHRVQLEGLVNNHIIGTSDGVVTMLEHLKSLLPYQEDFLITGENGAGKDAAVRTYLENTSRKIQGVLNVAELSSELVASELFGYKRGAFTGADKDSEGFIARFNRGIIFLDEIGELRLQDQAKLLRVLQNRQYRRIGDTETKDFDVQFIFATNQNLEKLVEKGKFREDLYYRIAAPSVTVTPLRERRLDIPLLAENILSSLNNKYFSKPKSIAAEVVDVLKKMNWPGNIRQLQNVIKDLHFRERTELISMDTLVKYAGEIRSKDQVLQAIVKQKAEILDEAPGHAHKLESTSSIRI